MMVSSLLQRLVVASFLAYYASGMSMSPRQQRGQQQGQQQQHQQYQQQLAKSTLLPTTPSSSSPTTRQSRSSIIKSGLFGTPRRSSSSARSSSARSSTEDSLKNDKKPTATTTTTTTSVTTMEQRDQFQRDGFVVISGLLTDSETSNLVSAGNQVVEASKKKKSGFYFKLAERGIMIGGPTNPDIETETERQDITQGFRTVALRSKLPQVAAELMGMDDGNDTDNDETIKVLRDIFLGKGVQEEKCCGWHVDDHSFWPQAYQSLSSSTNGNEEQQGINAWIAMQDMPAQYGGSLGLVPGSHKADWRHEAYENLGLDFNQEQPQSKQDVYQSIKENGFLSCVLDQTNPELSAQMDHIGHVPDLKCGDVIFHTRWLFHQTTPLTEEGKHYYETTRKTDCLNRYSIRYVPGSAELPVDFVNELAILANPTNAAGKALTTVPDGDAWYPTVWPNLDDDLDVKLKTLAAGQIPDATKVMQSNLNELLQILSGGGTTEPAATATTEEKKQ